jgi:hypothetical protein
MNKNRETLMKFISAQNQKVQNDISKQGYKDNSPYRNNPFNIIQGTPQGTSITMKGVSTPLIGIDEYGNKQYMQPGQEYQFPGSQVTETRVAKYGGLLNKTITCSNCGWEWKGADGGSDVMDCHKCGGKGLIKAQEGLTTTIKKNVEEEGLEYLNKVKDWYNSYTNSPRYKENLIKSGYEDPQAIIDRRLLNISNTGFRHDENRLGTYYNNRANRIHYSPIKDQINFPGDDIDTTLSHEVGHSSVDIADGFLQGFKPNYNKYDFDQLIKRKKKNIKNAADADENYADQKAIQYEAEKQGLYKAGYGEFTEEIFDKLKNSGIKERALKHYSKEDLIWLLNNIAQNDNNQPQLPVAQWGGRQQNLTSRDSVAHQADKILKYEQLRGSETGSGLSIYEDPKYKDQLMNEIYPRVSQNVPYGSAMEKSEMMDFIFNTGKDARVFAYQEYLRRTDPNNNTEWKDSEGKWKDRKNIDDATLSKLYNNSIGKLPENKRRQYINLGRDWYYKNTAPKDSAYGDWNLKSQGPHPAYNNTWYGRIWNTNDFSEFNPNNPKFTPKKQMGGAGMMYADRNYQVGGSPMFKSSSIPQADYVEPTYSYPLREKLYPGEDEYFKAHPEVTGMAAEDNQVIINPYSKLTAQQKEGIRMNETARLAMRNGYKRPTFDLTPEQQEFFSTIQDGKPYSEDLQDIRETIIGRILSGDDSAGNVTPEQKKYAEELQRVLKFQVGGSKKPIYVESENDPRYKAYNDSLSLYKTSLKNMWAEKNKSKSKVTKKGFIPFDEFDTFVLGSNLEYNDENRYPGEDFEAWKKKSTVVSKRKLNNLIKNNIKPIGFDVNEWKSDIKDKPTLNYSTVYKKPEQEVIVQGPEIESFQQLSPLQTIGTQIQASLPVIRPEAKVPKSYDVSTVFNSMKGPTTGLRFDREPFNRKEATLEQAMQILEYADKYNANIQEKYGTESWYYNRNSPRLEELAADRANKIKLEVDITPNYQVGGLTKYQTKGQVQDNSDVYNKYTSSLQSKLSSLVGTTFTPNLKGTQDEGKETLNCIGGSCNASIKSGVNIPLITGNDFWDQAERKKIPFMVYANPKNKGDYGEALDYAKPGDFIGYSLYDGKTDYLPAHTNIFVNRFEKDGEEYIRTLDAYGDEGYHYKDYKVSELVKGGPYGKLWLGRPTKINGKNLTVKDLGLTKYFNDFSYAKEVPEDVLNNLKPLRFTLNKDFVKKNNLTPDQVQQAAQIINIASTKKRDIIKNTGMSEKTYDMLAQGLPGIVFNETRLGDTGIGRNIYEFAKTTATKLSKEGASEGPFQIRHKMMFKNPQTRKVLETLGITSDNYDSSDLGQQTVMAMVLFDNIEKTSLKDFDKPKTIKYPAFSIEAARARGYNPDTITPKQLKDIQHEVVTSKRNNKDLSLFEKLIYLYNAPSIVSKGEAQGDLEYSKVAKNFLNMYTPKKQVGGTYTVSGEPLIIPSQGSYPFNYNNDLPVNEAGMPYITDKDGKKVLLSSAMKVPTKDEFGKQLTRNQIAYNQDRWNDQKEAYSPGQADFNVWKNNAENTQQGFYNRKEYDKIVKKFNKLPDVGLEGLESINKNSKSSAVSGSGILSKLNPFGPGCIYTTEDKSGQKKRAGGLVSYQEAGPVTKGKLNPKLQAILDKVKAGLPSTQPKQKSNKVNTREVFTATNDNILNASNEGAKIAEKFARQQRYEANIEAEKAQAQRTAQRQFNALSKEEQELVLNELYARKYGAITQGKGPDSKLSKFAQSLVLPMTALKDLYHTGEVRDDLIRSVLNNPTATENNALDAAYLGALGYIAAPYVASGATAIGATVAPYMAADFVVPYLGTTLTGVNLGNIATAGFATHGAMNIIPDAQKWVENPTMDNEFRLIMDMVEIAPIVGPAAKMMGEGLSATKRALTFEQSAIAKLDDIRNIGPKLEAEIASLKQQETLAEEAREALYADYKAGKITAEEYTTGAKQLNPNELLESRNVLEKQLRDYNIKQDIANASQQNILKSENQLGKNISDGGSNTKGVFELGDDYVARLSAHGYDNSSRLVNYANKIKSPRIAKTLQVKEINGKVYQVQNKATGTPITQLSEQEFKNIPKEHIDNFWKDKAELDELGLSIDISGGKSNILYDPKKGFQIIDLGIGTSPTNQVISDTYKGLSTTGKVETAAIDYANPIKDLAATFKNRNKKLITIGAENLDKELLKKITQLESPEGFNRLVAQEAEMLKRDFPGMVDLENKAISNAQTRISELYQTALQGNFNANYLEAKKLNSALTPQKFGIPRNNAFFRPGLGSSNFSDSVIDLSKANSPAELRNNIFAKEFYGIEMPGEIAIGREYAEGMPVYDHEINHLLQNTRNTALDDMLRKYFNNSQNLLKDFSQKTNKAYNYFRKSKHGVPSKEPSSFLAEARRAMLERGLIKDIYEPITPKKVFDAMKHFKTQPYKNPYTDQSYHRIFDFANDSPQTLKFLSDAFNKLPAILPVGLATGATAVGLSKEKQGGTVGKQKKALSWLNS